MKIPGPDHPITIEPHPGRLRVTRDGVTIAETSRALVLREAAYPAVFYVPRQDADMGRLLATTRSSHCPYKGDACYFSIASGTSVAENAVWSYADPYPAMARIAGHLAFYPDRVDAIEEGAA